WTSDVCSSDLRVKVVKNKIAPPLKQAEFDIIYGQGISREGSPIDMGVDNGIVRKSGSWFTYDGDQLGQGKENARGFLRDNPDLANELEKRIKEKLGIGARVDAPAEGAPAAAAAKVGAAAKAKKADACVRCASRRGGHVHSLLGKRSRTWPPRHLPAWLSRKSTPASWRCEYSPPHRRAARSWLSGWRPKGWTSPSPSGSSTALSRWDCSTTAS